MFVKSCKGSEWEGTVPQLFHCVTQFRGIKLSGSDSKAQRKRMDFSYGILTSWITEYGGIQDMNLH